MANPTPTLPGHVWTGWLEEFRQWVMPTTDACEESIYAAGLLALSCAIGRSVSISYGKPLYSNLYVAIVGLSGVARKTTVLELAQAVLKRAFTPDWLRWTAAGSGEGLLEQFCRQQESSNGNGHKQTIFAPIPGQRVILDEPEFTTLFVKMARSGTANLHETLLNLYDGKDYSPHTRSKPIDVREPFFSIMSSTTPAMLEKRVDDTHLTSGLLPRFAFFQATAREPMPYPDLADPAGLERLATGLQRLSQYAQDLNQILVLSPEARQMWGPVYIMFIEEQRAIEGVGAELLTRITALAMKVALVYAVMRGHRSVFEEDLQIGITVARYCQDVALQLSLSQLDTTQDGRLVERILKYMPEGEWLMSSKIFQSVSGYKLGAGKFHQALEGLVQEGILDKKIVTVRGRERPMYRKVKL